MNPQPSSIRLPRDPKRLQNLLHNLQKDGAYLRHADCEWGVGYLASDESRRPRTLRQAILRLQKLSVFPVPRGGFTLWEEKEGAADAGLLTDCTIPPLRRRITDLPENHEYEISFKPSAKIALAYKQMKDIQLSLADGGVINAVNAASAYMEPRKFSEQSMMKTKKPSVSTINVLSSHRLI